jgi:hypothetical protein
MRSALKQALADCLTRLEAGVGIEECLRGHEALAVELRPLLEAAQALRAHNFADYRPEASQSGRARMHAARIAETERGRRPAWGGPWRPLALAGVAAAVAVMAALGFATDIFRFNADTTSAQVQGVVSSVDQGMLTVRTPNGDVVVTIGENTVVRDVNGNEIAGDAILPGSSARIEYDEGKEGSFEAHNVEVEDEDDEHRNGAEVEFSGVVQAVNGSTLTVQAPFGVATVRIDADTEVKGTLSQGAGVKLHATVQADGSYLAREIEVSGPQSGDGGGDGGGGSDGGGDGSGTPDGGSGDDHSGSDSTPSDPDSGGDSSGSSDDEPDTGED